MDRPLTVSPVRLFPSCLVLSCLTAPSATAATVPVWALGTASDPLPDKVDIASKLLAHAEVYRDLPGLPPQDLPLVFGHVGLLCAYALVVAATLPRSRRAYAARAAVAMSRMRATIARKPLERWEERCSSSPSRASSAEASTSSASSAVKPS